MMRPIFVVGCQRSGSTMLGAMLGGAAEALAIPEAQFVADCAPADAQEELELAKVIDSIASHYRFKIWNFDLAGARPEGRGQFADAIRWLVSRYAAAVGKPDATVWIDHQPGHVREMALLKSHFPDLKAVHIIRDGRAVAASLLPLDWGPNAVISAANYWCQRTAMGSALRDFLGESAYSEVRYEDLVREPEREVRLIADAIGLGYNPAMAAGGEFRVPDFTQSQHALVGRRPDASRLDSWRRQLSSREIEIFEALVGPLLTYHGYNCDNPDARLPGLLEKARITLRDQWLARRNAQKFERRVARHAD